MSNPRTATKPGAGTSLAGLEPIDHALANIENRVDLLQPLAVDTPTGNGTANAASATTVRRVPASYRWCTAVRCPAFSVMSRPSIAPDGVPHFSADPSQPFYFYTGWPSNFDRSHPRDPPFPVAPPQPAFAAVLLRYASGEQIGCTATRAGPGRSMSASGAPPRRMRPSSSAAPGSFHWTTTRSAPGMPVATR